MLKGGYLLSTHLAKALFCKLPMFKSSCLCRSAICRRVVVMLTLWAIFLVGANEIRRAADGDSSLYAGIKRLAVYSMAIRAGQ
jgi:hypothetical protein